MTTYSPNPARVTPLADVEADFLRGEAQRLAEALAASEASRARLARYVRAEAVVDSTEYAYVQHPDEKNTATYTAALNERDVAEAALLPADLALSQNPPDPGQSGGNVSPVGNEHG